MHGYNLQTKKIGKTAKGEEEKIKQLIIRNRDVGLCDRNGKTIKHYDAKEGRYRPQTHAGKGDRDRVEHNYDLDELYRLAARNVWPRDEDGNLIED